MSCTYWKAAPRHRTGDRPQPRRRRSHRCPTRRCPTRRCPSPRCPSPRIRILRWPTRRCPTRPWPTRPWPTRPWPTRPWPTRPWPTRPWPTRPWPTRLCPTLQHQNHWSQSRRFRSLLQNPQRSGQHNRSALRAKGSTGSGFSSWEPRELVPRFLRKQASSNAASPTMDVLPASTPIRETGAPVRTTTEQVQPAGVRVLAETVWLPSTVMLPSAAIVTA